MLTVAVQYPSFGPQHPPRLEAIVRRSPYPDARVVAMEMFRKDSDYEWAPVTGSSLGYCRYTVMDCDSASGRADRGALRRAVAGALDALQPDVLVVNGWGHPESQVSLEWTRRNGTATVLLSDSRYEDLPRNWIKEAYKRWIVRGAKSAFVAGTPQARYAVRLGIPADKVFYPGSCVVDNDYWHERTSAIRAEGAEHRRRLGLPERYFLANGRFIPKKNFPFLIRAYARYRVQARDHAFALVLCGSGPQEGEIGRTISQCGAPEVVLSGFRQVGDLPFYYALAECFVMPSSHFEQWGLVLNEAMASSLPVLVSRNCGAAEDLVKRGVNGFLFDPTDEQELADLMARISGDAELRAGMAEASWKIIGGHSCDVGAANFWQAVAAALPEHRAARSPQSFGANRRAMETAGT